MASCIARLAVASALALIAGCSHAPSAKDGEGRNALATWVPSENHNARDALIVVLHATQQDSALSSLDTLRSRNIHGRVSAHYLIGRDGTLYQLVSEERRAWHAGGGRWGTITDLNSASIGIELDNDGRSSFTEPQLASLLVLLEDLCKRLGIPRRQVIGHADMAPSRKTDPGALFPWKRLAEAGFGRWPDAGARKAAVPESFDGWTALQLLGYRVDKPQDALRAFRLHFRGIDDALTPMGHADRRVLHALVQDELRAGKVEKSTPATAD